MNDMMFAARLGLARGWTEFRHTLTSAQDVGFNLVMGVAFLMVLVFERDAPVEGTPMSLAMSTLPSMLGLVVALGGLIGASGRLAGEREDGTLLRAKAVPHGMVGYVVGRVLSASLETMLTMLIILVPGLFLLDELMPTAISRWLTLAWMLALGLLATLPWGVILGSLLKSARGASLVMLPIMGLVMISGIFIPMSVFAGWVQGVAQVFPVYWLGLGMRSAFLPAGAAGLEIAGSWRTAETVAALGAWAVAGLVLAPIVLRRMARRESGASMEARRRQAMQRIT